MRDAAQIVGEVLPHTDTCGSSSSSKEDVAWTISKNDLHHVRVGVPDNIRTLQTINNTKRDAFEHAVLLLQDAGAGIIHSLNITGAKEHESLFQKSKQIILDADLELSMEYHLSTLASNTHGLTTLEDIIRFTEECDAEEYPRRDVGGLERADTVD